tara:strand:- start:141 stop:341 length:201 start_codon:yes stop_codon:yes gene_type:complete
MIYILFGIIILGGTFVIRIFCFKKKQNIKSNYSLEKCAKCRKQLRDIEDYFAFDCKFCRECWFSLI